MTSTTVDPGTTAGTPPGREIRVTQPGVVRSEWIKLRSLRSTVYTLLASVAMTVGIGLLFAVFVPSSQRGNIDGLGLSLRGVYLAQLAIGVLGVLLISGEYATGMIRATLSAVPRRLPVLWAKLGVFAVVATVTSVAASFVAFLGGQAILSSRHLGGMSLSDPGVPRVVVGAGLFLGLVGLFGMALGFIIRNTAGAITTLFGILLILPVLGAVLPASWQHDIVPYLPSSAGQAIMMVHPTADTLAPWTGLGLFAGYTLAAIAAAAVLLRRRDA